MGAAEHHDIGLLALALAESGHNFMTQLVEIGGPSLEFFLGDLGQPLGTMQEDLAVIGIGVDERMGIFAADGSGRCQNPDDAGFRLCRGRLDRRHRADEG